MDELIREPADAEPVESDAQARRAFLAGLGKWSAAVIGGVAFAGLFGQARNAEAGGWANRRGLGGGWVNGGGGYGGGGWVNRAGGYGGGWANRAVGGGAWANRAGGGGGGWANRRGLGGGAWVNNR